MFIKGEKLFLVSRIVYGYCGETVTEVVQGGKNIYTLSISCNKLEFFAAMTMEVRSCGYVED